MDAPAAISSAAHLQVVGFRLVLDAIDAQLSSLRHAGTLSETEYDAVTYVHRQATDANRAMEQAQAAPPINSDPAASADRIRQIQLIGVKAGHLLELNPVNGITASQSARKAINAARRRLLSRSR